MSNPCRRSGCEQKDAQQKCNLDSDLLSDSEKKSLQSGSLSKVDIKKKEITISKREEYLERLETSMSRLKILSAEEIIKMSVVECDQPTCYGNGSVGDCRMGTIEHNQLCQTCYKTTDYCPGHPGRITLAQCFLNPMCIKMFIWTMHSICQKCGSLLIDRDQIEKSGLLQFSESQRLQKIADISKKHSCMNNKVTGEVCPPNMEFKVGELENHSSDCIVGKKKEETCPITIERVLTLFRLISKEDLETLGFNQSPKGMGGKNATEVFLPTSPVDFILQVLPVIPPCARVYNIRDGIRREDHLTDTYCSIIRTNNNIRTIKSEGRARNTELDNENKNLYFNIRHLMDNTDKCGRKGNDEQIKSIRERIGGKEEAIRGYAMGKRNDFTGRTVVGPDTKIKFGEAACPERMRRVLTTPETVNNYNIVYLNDLLKKGEITHHIPKSGKYSGGRFRITKNNTVEELKIGDIVHRWARDGDEIIVNRQPTLHKQGIMTYKAVFKNHERAGLHSANTVALNADFDGDEVNFHKLQTLLARAEGRGIMSTCQNIMNAQESKPIIGLVFNSVSSAYLLTDGSVYPEGPNAIPLNYWNKATSFISDKNRLLSLPDRLRKHGVTEYSGHALFSTLLPIDFYYSNKKGENEVLIIDGVLIKGRIKKDHIGPTSGSIIQYLWKMYGSDVTSQFITEGQWILDYYIEFRGLSVGYDSCIPSTKERDRNLKNIIETAVEKATIEMNQVPIPDSGATRLEKQSYETKIQNILNKISEIGAEISDKVLEPSNPLRTMTESGAKGKEQNIAQIVGLLGQQFVQGQRSSKDIGFNNDRCLPYFQKEIEDTGSRGFISTSYVQGMNPAGMVFHMEASRIGLLNTAIFTAQTGSMHHRLNKATEDIMATYDGAVCNTNGVIFRPIYDDGFDSSELLKTKSKSMGNFFSFIDMENVIGKLNYEN